MNKIRVTLIIGGRSAEHEISLRSSRSIIDAIDKTKYEVELIGIDKSGKWMTIDIDAFRKSSITALSPSTSSSIAESLSTVLTALSSADVIFPVLHGPYGEDGTIQGLFRLMNKAFVGPDVLGSAMGMDKVLSKRIAEYFKIDVAPYAVVYSKEEMTFAEAEKRFQTPLFVKPARAGSSVGVHKVTNQKEYSDAMNDAFEFDSKVLIEKAVVGREVECAVLGNRDVKASVAGEIIPKNQFYSYEAKYLDENGAELSAPAKITGDQTKELQQKAITIFRELDCEGLARVDFFLTKDGKFVFNEINTMPGFTSISMYPRLWQLSGTEFPQLIDKLITLAQERYNQQSKLKTNYENL